MCYSKPAHMSYYRIRYNLDMLLCMHLYTYQNNLQNTRYMCLDNRMYSSIYNYLNMRCYSYLYILGHQYKMGNIIRLGLRVNGQHKTGCITAYIIGIVFK